jgi:hypothetical protein
MKGGAVLELEDVEAVSLAAAIERATGLPGYEAVLPLIGMARAELTDFGQRRQKHYVPMKVDDVTTAVGELEDRVAALLVNSQDLQHSLRLDAALQLLRRITAA